MTIELTQIRKSFGDFVALNGVDLTVKDGELLALLGPSGSGKTTLLRIIAGLDFADSGSVKINGQEASGLPVKARNVGFVFQHYALFKHMTVFDNVAFGLRVRPRAARPDKEAIDKKVMSLLKLVHLHKFYDRYPSQLSGGQRQRVALARSLAVEPKLLLLDEPFGALDAKVRKELRRWLRRLHEEIHVTSIFVTHDQEEAMEVSDRVVVMNHGKIEQIGSPEEVYHRPKNGFVYDFLGNYNEFAGWKDVDGAIHLAEDGMQGNAVFSAIASPPQKTGLFSRYPEMTRLFKHFSPRREAKTQPRPSRPLASVLAERGTPVRVFARPHEMFVAKTPEAGHEYIPVKVTHINPAGPLASLEMERENGLVLQAEVPKTIIDSLAIQKGDHVYVRPKNTRVFE